MAFFYVSPKWFFGFDIGLELLFGIVTALVAIYSWRIYSLCQERECRQFALAFGSMSVAYFIWPLVNFFAFSFINSGSVSVQFGKASALLLAGIYAHVIFFLLGLSLLAYLSFGFRDYKLYSLIASISIVVVILSRNAGLSFNFVSAVLLFYISFNYYLRFEKVGGRKVFLTMIAFVLLFLARFVLTFAQANHPLYVVNHLTELLAYVIIMVSLIKTVGKNGKKKQTRNHT